MFNYTEREASQVEFVEIAPADQLPAGERMFIEVEGNSIVIFNLAGKLYAIGDVCSHDGGPLGDGELSGFDIVCPRHGAHFDVRTGEALLLPAVEDIPAYPVRIRNGNIELGVPTRK